VALVVALGALGTWWTLAYHPHGPPPAVVVVERRGCDICICANPCPCDCECECSVMDSAASKEHAKAIHGAQGPVRHAPQTLGLVLGIAALLLPFGFMAAWRRRHR
jgi:hypothetical protein